MDFAAAPIVNTPAPPARPDAGVAGDAANFRDHLDAERAAETRRSSQTERPDAADASAEDDEQNDQATAAPIVLTAPVIVQIVIAAPAETQAPPPGNAELAPVAPISGAAPPQAPALPLQQAKQTNATPKDQAKSESPPDAEVEDSAQFPQASSPAIGAEAPDTAAAAAPTAAPSQPASTAPLTQTSPPSAEVLAALQVSAQPASKPQQQQADSETAPRIGGGAEARRDAPSPQQVEPTKAQGKAANAQNNAQTKSAETPFQPVQEAPAPMQTASPLQAPSSHAPTQVLQPSSEQSASRAAPATAQVGREIIRRFNGHNTQFELRLDPPELGRVDVRLEVGRDHRVTATISADTPQALAEMARHARELEQSLQSAGLELAHNGLSFDLRQGSGEERETAAEKGGGQVSALTPEEEMQTIAPRARPVGFERWRGVRVDVMA